MKLFVTLLTCSFSMIFYFTFATENQNENVSVSVENPLYLIHMPKTGGVSIRNYFAQQYFNYLEEDHGVVSLIPGYAGVLHKHKPVDFTKDTLLNRTACSVGFFSLQLKPRDLALMLFQIELGLYGPVKCRRGWWDHQLVSRYSTSLPLIEETVLTVYERLKNSKQKLSNEILKKMVNVDVTQLSLDLILKSTCIVNFREPMDRMFSHYYFYNFLRKSNLSFVEFGNKFGDDLLWHATFDNPQQRYIGNERSPLRKEILNHCIIGVRERFDLIIKNIDKLLPFAPSLSTQPFPSSKLYHSIESVPKEMRKSLAEFSKADGVLWAEVYKKVIGENPIRLKNCSWCVEIWSLID